MIGEVIAYTNYEMDKVLDMPAVEFFHIYEFLLWKNDKEKEALERTYHKFKS